MFSPDEFILNYLDKNYTVTANYIYQPSRRRGKKTISANGIPPIIKILKIVYTRITMRETNSFIPEYDHLGKDDLWSDIVDFIDKNSDYTEVYDETTNSLMYVNSYTNRKIILMVSHEGCKDNYIDLLIHQWTEFKIGWQFPFDF